MGNFDPKQLNFDSTELKNIINVDLINKFSLDDMKKEKFIPITCQDGAIFVGMIDANNKEKRKSILTNVIITTKLKPKIVIISEEQFNSFIQICSNIISATKDILPEPQYNDLEIFDELEENNFEEEKLEENKLKEYEFEENKSEEEKLEEIKSELDENIFESESESQVETNENIISHESIISNFSKKTETLEINEQEQEKPVEPPKEPEKKPKKRLGEQLIDMGLITEEQLLQALDESKQTETPIGSVLVKLGFITIEQLRETLSTQLGVDHVETKDLQIEAEVIKFLPEKFIKENKVVPIRVEGHHIIIGMVNPNDKRSLSQVIYLTGHQPIPLVLTHIEFEECIANYFKTKTEVKKEAEKLMKELSYTKELNVVQEEDLWSHVEKELQEDDTNFIAKLASSVITDAIERKASDIHIEPYGEQFIVRYRIDGILKKVLDLPPKIETLILSRLKVIAKMNIAEHRRPQDGHFTIKYDDRLFDLRVNTLPVAGKEKMVIRILQPTIRVEQGNKEIRLLGASHQDIQKIDLMVTSPYGIILTSGPTGSGKTTTLYSILNKLNTETVNITTIEDPVEIKLEGINQVQVNQRAEITFASSMRAILRQDPDIIMVGEIRDIETLEAAIDASLTGHLVLSTVHANTATATVTRLMEMGVAAHLIAASLLGVIAQRLIRKVCPDCKELYEPTK
ncbi:MAG: ATPase, T2SS/T4P/T4SS family, partial [Candidatus Gastranaerophilales bacterium]|nr:ATPase, T2SS/T4P/T4SS family [Candidatus Gastranaerophilales bacterium]